MYGITQHCVYQTNQNDQYLNTTAISYLLKYPGFLVEKRGFQVVENSQKKGFGFRKTWVGNTICMIPSFQCHENNTVKHV